MREAFTRTSVKRGVYHIIKGIKEETLDNIRKSEELEELWARYQKTYDYAEELEWHQVVRDVVSFIETVVTGEK